jgi:hypothetical protein
LRANFNAGFAALLVRWRLGRVHGKQPEKTQTFELILLSNLLSECAQGVVGIEPLEEHRHLAFAW